MRYFYLGVLLLVGLVSNSMLTMPHRTVWEFGSLILIDIGLVVGVYAIFLRYWVHGHWRRETSGLVMVWFGAALFYMGTYVLITGDYYLNGDRIRTALYRDILNALGEFVGPSVVAGFWFIVGAAAIYYGLKAYRNA